MSPKNFFMVYVEGERTPSYEHENLHSAETEAKRLAKALGKKAFVLCSLKSFEVNHFNVEDCRPYTGEELPF